MTTENKGTIILPTALSVNGDAVQVFPLDSDRVFDYQLTAGQSVDHALSDDCEAIKVLVMISSDDEFPIVTLKRGLTDKVAAFFSGSFVRGVVGGVRTLTLSLPGSGTAVVKIEEA